MCVCACHQSPSILQAHHHHPHPRCFITHFMNSQLANGGNAHLVLLQQPMQLTQCADHRKAACYCCSQLKTAGSILAQQASQTGQQPFTRQQLLWDAGGRGFDLSSFDLSDVLFLRLSIYQAFSFKVVIHFVQYF